MSKSKDFFESQKIACVRLYEAFIEQLKLTVKLDVLGWSDTPSDVEALWDEPSVDVELNISSIDTKLPINLDEYVQDDSCWVMYLSACVFAAHARAALNENRFDTYAKLLFSAMNLNTKILIEVERARKIEVLNDNNHEHLIVILEQDARIRSENARRSVLWRYEMDKDGKKEAMKRIYQEWLIWNETQGRKNKTKFADDMRQRFKLTNGKSMLPTKSITDKIRDWERGIGIPE